MKFLSAIASLAVLAVSQAIVEGPYFRNAKTCYAGTPNLKSIGPSIFPMPFCPGSTYVFTIRGNLSEPLVQGAKLIVNARIDGKLVYTDEQDYCKLLSTQPQACPVPAGKSVDLYAVLPKKAGLPVDGVVDYTFHATTPNGKTVFCWASTLSGAKCSPTPTPSTTIPTPTPTYSPRPVPPTYPASENCAAGVTDQNVTAFTLTPSDYCIGKTYTVTTTGPLALDIILGAKFALTGRYLGRIIYVDNKDLCALLAAAGTPCPVAKTADALSFALTIKPSLPFNWPVQYTYLATNGNNHVIFCRATTIIGKKCAA
ncbi:hypothetical protein BGZ82_011747 [Podila clonocystis]|nr:hypothetical protein BGZ82_011747 [Podila clonocystis]